MDPRLKFAIVESAMDMPLKRRRNFTLQGVWHPSLRPCLKIEPQGIELTGPGERGCFTASKEGEMGTWERDTCCTTSSVELCATGSWM